MLPVVVALAALPPPRLLAVDNFVVGEYRDRKWQEVSEESPRSKTYPRSKWYPVDLVSTRGAVLTRGTKIETEGYYGVYLSGTETNGLGVYLSGARPTQPRRVERLPVSNSYYGGVLRRWLDAKGMTKSPVRIKALLRTDLDGDGTKEILIEARSADDLPVVGFEREENLIDYSLILLRAIRAGRPVELPLAFSRGNGPQGSSGESTLRAIADLDGDGRMEIVSSWRAWEAFSSEIRTYRAGATNLVLQNGSAL